MLWFILSILFLVVAIGLGLASFASKEYGRNFAAAAVGMTLLAVVVFLLSGIREVPTKSVGVPTAWGKVESPALPGLHWKAPWTVVNILPTKIQTTVFNGPHLKGDVTAPGHNCLPIRIGGQQQACLNVTIQWQPIDAAAGNLYNDYGSGGGDVIQDVKNAVVVRELEQAVNQQMGDYNPIQDVSISSSGKVAASKFTTFQPLVLKQMKREIGQRIHINSIIIPSAIYQGQTQARLEKIQFQFADTAVAKQEIQTNINLATAANKLAAALRSNPNVVISNCITGTIQAINNGNTFPAGWSCTGGGSALALSSH